jgi:phospholipid transport system substrate-binding protein
MMKRMKSLAILLLVAGLGLAAPVARAESATDTGASDVVRGFYTTLVGTMKDGPALGFDGREKKLAPAVKSAFNLPLMTRFAVGPVWIKATPSEQQQLIRAFSDFSVATYANQFTKYDGEQFDVLGQKPASGGGVIVDTKLTPGDGSAPVTLDYLMKQDDRGAWRIVDVFLDGSISQLATRRSEFTSIVERDGIPALVNQLGDKAKQMGPS